MAACSVSRRDVALGDHPFMPHLCPRPPLCLQHAPSLVTADRVTTGGLGSARGIRRLDVRHPGIVQTTT